MKIYLLTSEEGISINTYDACVVCAENEEDAKTIGPEDWPRAWPKTPGNIKCTEIGTANENQTRGIILASFNAG